jgi:tetratricopeptide (TPR) repeat protein
VLGVRRDQQDIPGFLIPQLYRDYLRTRATADMQRVLYHNAFDVLSMVTLAARIADAVAAPATPAEHLSIAAYYDRLGDDARAEAAYRAAASDASDASYAPALRRLAQSYKRRQRPSDALGCWQALAESGDAAALVELAKHFEWRAADLDRALGCARQALGASHDAQASAEIRHRIDRLERKLAARQEDRP